MQFDLFSAFMFRRPALDAEDMRRRLAARGPEQVFGDGDIQELFRHSLPEQHARFTALLAEGAPTPALLRALRRYLVRLSHRPTPFCCFAGVGVKSWDSLPGKRAPARMVRWGQSECAGSSLVLNPHLRLGTGFATVYPLRGERAYSLDAFKVDADLGRFLGLAPREGTAADYRRAMGEVWDADEDERAELLTQLQEAGVLLPPSLASHQGPDPEERDETPHVGLWFDDEALDVTVEGARAATKVALEFSSFVARMRAEMRKGDWWAAATAWLDDSHDHGPVPFTAMTEKNLRPVRERLPAAGPPGALESWLVERALANPVEWHVSDEEWAHMQGSTPPPAVVGLHWTLGGQETPWLLDGVLSRSAASILGRFGFFDPACSALIREVQAEEEGRAVGLAADIEFRPQKEKLRFLQTRHVHLRRYIDLSGVEAAGRERLRPDELAFVRRRDQRWVLTHTPSQRTVEPHVTHMVNPRKEFFFPYLLLRDYAARDQVECRFFPWGRLAAGLPTLPRVVRGGVVLSARRWRVRGSEELAALAARGAIVPTLQLLTESDRFPGEARDPFFQHEVDRACRRGPVWLEEDLAAGLGHRHELVTFARTRAPRAPSPDVRVHEARAERPFVNFRLLVDPSLKDLVLLRLAEEPELREQSFFVYFTHPRFCLRWRCRRDLAARATALFSSLLRDGLLHGFEEIAYTPETARWGGGEGSHLQEELSIWDTRLQLARRAATEGSYEILDEASAMLLGWLGWLCPTQSDASEVCRSAMADQVAGGRDRSLGFRWDWESQVPPAGGWREPPEELRLAWQRWQGSAPPATRVLWIRSFLHMVLNRAGVAGQPVEEKLCYAQVFRARRLYLPP